MKKYLGISAGIVAGVLLLSTAPAMARVDVDVHLGIPAPIYAPAPVYVAPRPVYVQPRPVYVHPHRHYHHKRYYRDRDRDGVPNRYDRRPNNPYRY
jgi:hypothetical protein